MEAFSLDQWLVLLLAFLLGLFLGMAFLAGGKWKRRYREEVRRREAIEAENRHFRKELQSDTTHRDTAKAADRRPEDRPV
jgi:uncharacterized membrane-anchored protein YhcB (DUF1043 family)